MLYIRYSNCKGYKTMTDHEELLHKVKDILTEHVKTEFMLENKIMWFGAMTINWINIKEDSVTLQFVMNRGMSLYGHTMNILNDLFLHLFRRKISESKNYNDFIMYNKLTLTYEELSYVYMYLSLKYR